MTRWLTLIMFSFGVLHASWGSLPQGGHTDCATVCGSHSAPEIETVSSCCPLGDITAQTSSGDYCPMSNGPCACGVESNENRTPGEPMPMPHRDRDTLQMVRAPPVAIMTIPTYASIHLMGVVRSGSINSGLTHNQVQALLGVWRR